MHAALRIFCNVRDIADCSAAFVLLLEHTHRDSALIMLTIRYDTNLINTPLEFHRVDLTIK